MRKLSLTVFVFLLGLNSSCFGQEKEKVIKSTINSDGQRINYITDNTYQNISIDGMLKLNAIEGPDAIKKVIESLGQPIDIKHEKDTAIDGTTLFERKLVVYQGLRFLFPKKEDFVLSKIELSSGQHSLHINDSKLQVGMHQKSLNNLFTNINLENKTKHVNIDVAETTSEGMLKKDGGDNIHLSFKNVTIEINPDTEKISKISISIRYT